jgi:hypothetical protein
MGATVTFFTDKVNPEIASPPHPADAPTTESAATAP